MGAEVAPSRASFAALTRSVTSVGAATPIVSASAISAAPAAAARRTISTTRSTGTSPSYGQPNAVEIVRVARIPASLASGAIASNTATVSSLVAPWLRIANVSVVTATTLISRIPAAAARCRSRGG